MQNLPLTHAFLNQVRKSLRLAPMPILPSLDHAAELPKWRTSMCNPLHVMFGLALHGHIREWWLDAWDDGDCVEIQFRYIVRKTEKRVVQKLPDDVWAELCTKYPVVCGFVYTDRASRDNVWGLPKGGASKWPAERQKNQVPFDLLT